MYRLSDAYAVPPPVPALQVAHSPYSGPMDCMRQIVRTEGFGALYRSYR